MIVGTTGHAKKVENGGLGCAGLHPKARQPGALGHARSNGMDSEGFRTASRGRVYRASGVHEEMS